VGDDGSRDGSRDGSKIENQNGAEKRTMAEKED
jgi:hypothetical protein